MNKKLLSTAVAIMFAFVAQAQVKIYDFPFNSSLSATVGTGTFTSSSGVSYSTDRVGNPLGAVHMNNTGLTGTLSGLPLAGTSRTISLWVKLDTVRNDYNFLFSYGATEYYGAYCTGSNLFNFLPNHSVATPQNSNTWYHFVFTYDGTDSKIYKDGVLLSSSAVTFNTMNNSDKFTLGLTENGWQDYFRGSIDDLKIYNFALTAAEVRNLYSNNEINVTGVNDLHRTNDLIALYPNPTVDLIHFSTQINLRLTNISGQVIGDFKNIRSLDITEQPAGIYFLVFTDDKENVVQRSKIVKE